MQIVPITQTPEGKQTLSAPSSPKSSKEKTIAKVTNPLQQNQNIPCYCTKKRTIIVLSTIALSSLTCAISALFYNLIAGGH